MHVAPIKQARKDVDLWPLLAEAKTPAEIRVNQKLERLNRRLVLQLSECDADYRKWLAAVGEQSTSKAQTGGDWSRTVAVTMHGPRYLSLVATDEVFCGGAHPDSDEVALVFDMTTGEPVDWVAMVAKRAGASAYADTVIDGSTVGALVLPALATMYTKAADDECKDDASGGAERSFQLWPDAKAGTLVAVEFDLPHVVRACAVPLSVSMAQARELGFSEEILREIEVAHHNATTQR
jgi:hypothetical protein